MRRIRHAGLLTLLGAILSLGLLTGCGGKKVEESNKYVDQVNKVQQKFATEASKIGSSGASTPAALQKTFTDLGDKIGGLADELEGIKPPDRVKDVHAKLVKVLRDYKDDLAGLAKKIDPKDPAAAASAAADISTTTSKLVTDFDATIDELNKKLRE